MKSFLNKIFYNIMFEITLCPDYGSSASAILHMFAHREAVGLSVPPTKHLSKKDFTLLVVAKYPKSNLWGQAAGWGQAAQAANFFSWRLTTPNFRLTHICAIRLQYTTDTIPLRIQHGTRI